MFRLLAARRHAGVWSNAGLIVDGEANLLVDTLSTSSSHARCWTRCAMPWAAKTIGKLVNTMPWRSHLGNRSSSTEIMGALSTREEMLERPPSILAEIVRNRAQLGEGAQFLYGSWVRTSPSMTSSLRRRPAPFEGTLTSRWATRQSSSCTLVPPHTRGDTLVDVRRIDRLCRRPHVRRRPPGYLGGPSLELDQGVRPILGWDGMLSCQARCDHRQGQVCAFQRLSRVSQQRGAPALMTPDSATSSGERNCPRPLCGWSIRSDRHQRGLALPPVRHGDAT